MIDTNVPLQMRRQPATMVINHNQQRSICFPLSRLAKLRAAHGGQVFARKLIRVSGVITEDNILKEARQIDKIRRIGHKQIVHIIDHGRLPRDPSFYFLDMEVYLNSHIQSGKTALIRDARQSGKELSIVNRFKTTLRVASHIADGLSFLHRLDEIHWDLKPTNGFWALVAMKLTFEVLYSSRDSKWKLSDFGFVVEHSSKRAISTKDMETIESYQSPEVAFESSPCSFKLDIWALGCIVYEMATQRKAFSNGGDLRKFVLCPHKFVLGPLNSTNTDDITFRIRELEVLINDMLQIDPGKRPTASSCLAMVNSLPTWRGEKRC